MHPDPGSDDDHTEVDDRPAEDAGGDPVCWLDRLCPECGAMPTERTGQAGPEEPAACWRCGRLE